MELPERVEPTTQELLRSSFEMWIKALGLAWWDIKIEWYTDPAEIVRVFGTPGETKMVACFCTALWEYGEARIEVNVSAFDGKTREEVDRIVVHELMHILVNEMREKGIKHEERVVTNLTKAFFWALEATERAYE